LRDFGWLADENISPEVVAELRSLGFDVVYVRDSHLVGSDDVVLIRHAYSEGCVILTHDSDFGALSIARLEPIVGVIFLRPGHIDPRFTIETLQVLFKQDLQLKPPFLIVAKRTGDEVAIRVRSL
jgi:predicted nuclease of predicted toxin-antitoxin system